MKVLQALAERGLYLQRQHGQPLQQSVAPREDMLAMFARAQTEGRDLFEFEAKNLLRAHDVAVAEERVVQTADELAEVAAYFGEQALAMKVVSKDILHKSDAGGVKLNLKGETALRAGFEQILSNCRSYDANADIRGVLVAPMAKKGIEVIVGVVRDPIFGPVLMFGLGGIFVEILEDVAFRAIPLSRRDAESMVEQLKARKILAGVRGEPPVDKAAAKLPSPARATAPTVSPGGMLSWSGAPRSAIVERGAAPVGEPPGRRGGDHEEGAEHGEQERRAAEAQRSGRAEAHGGITPLVRMMLP